MPEVGLFSIADSSWWATALYSLMRLDASYPNSTAVTEWEVALLAALGLLLLAVAGLLSNFVSAVLAVQKRRMLTTGIPLVAVYLLHVQFMHLVATNCGAYDLEPAIPERIPVVNEVPTPDLFTVRFRGQPVIARDPSADLALWRPQELGAVFKSGSAAMQVGNVEQGNASYKTLKLGKFFETLDDEEAAAAHKKKHGHVPYLAEENNILRHGGDKYMGAVDALFRKTVISDAAYKAGTFHFTDVWIWAGPAGARTGLHADWDPVNLLHQLYGRKKLWLFPPQDTERCYPSQKYDLGATIAQVDPFNPDLKRFPAFADAKPLLMELQPGDVAQVPAGWMHYAECVTACVAISGRSFSLSQTLVSLPGVAGAVLHRFGLYGMQGGSTSGYIAGKQGASEPAAWERLRNISWYRAAEEYD